MSSAVERVADRARRTAYARRTSAEFRYSHAWFSYAALGDTTEMRCVCDFEMADGARLSDDEMATVMASGLRRNMHETARRIERATKGDDNG